MNVWSGGRELTGATDHRLVRQDPLSGRQALSAGPEPDAALRALL